MAAKKATKKRVKRKTKSKKTAGSRTKSNRKKPRAKKKTRKKTKKKTDRKRAAKKKPALKKTKVRQKKSAKAHAPQVVDQSLAQQNIADRLAALETAVSSIQAGAFAIHVLAEDAAAVTIECEKTEGPDLVRFFVDGDEVIAAFEDEGKYQSQVDMRHSGRLEIAGNPGDKAVVTLTKALPASVPLEIRDGRTQEIGTFLIIVTG